LAALHIRDPPRSDEIDTGNLGGDILSDQASELSGCLGRAGSVTAGDYLCVAKAQPGSAPDIAGQDKANPTSLILSAAMMLEWMGQRHRSDALLRAAAAIEAAVDSALADPQTRTADLKGPLGTQAFARVVAGKIG
jgi:3-isopropylmalate dehydrogenase